MKFVRCKSFLWVPFVAALVLAPLGYAQDPNFHIYLAFGQSNMEGNGAISTADSNVNDRFQMISAVNCGTRKIGDWMKAVPPLFRCETKLSPADYFGRTLVEKLPANIKVGVVPVAIAGAKIEIFDKVNYQAYLNSAESWLKNIAAQYGGNPYARLVEVAKLAQQKGVIKGILLHQGESNTNDPQWTNKVKAVYNNLITDLGLDASKVPLLAGQLVGTAEGGACGGMNTTINTLPNTLPNSYVISSSGLPHGGDGLHFTPESYRTLGKRYADKMLTLLGPVSTPTPEVVWMEAECGAFGSNWESGADAAASNGNYIAAKTGVNSAVSAPTTSDYWVVLPFKIDSAQTFSIYARMNAASASDDSYWIQMDNEPFEIVNELATTGWEWKALASKTLSIGNHTLTIGLREDGAKLDKISITNSLAAPTTLGGGATCIVPVAIHSRQPKLGYSLEQSQVNVNGGTVTIGFEIPEPTFVSIKVYSIHGEEVAELAGKNFGAGKHSIEVESSNFPQGVYFYTMKANSFSASRKMLTQMP